MGLWHELLIQWEWIFRRGQEPSEVSSPSAGLKNCKGWNCCHQEKKASLWNLEMKPTLWMAEGLVSGKVSPWWWNWTARSTSLDASRLCNCVRQWVSSLFHACHLTGRKMRLGIWRLGGTEVCSGFLRVMRIEHKASPSPLKIGSNWAFKTPIF